ncbi:MAG TPA: prepilin-type N-terminal cleavage/methylation domain-containing protein [Gemmatimonadaceae bacterium]|jgi:prepilin-type N-terminal cleavage/methylation domain-containing protein|nr:prepilin-type N-terminal cleavage/methylation domain-containing protein [Gemmatimonadaceae bacterium]
MITSDQKNAREGFSIVEVLVAVTLLGVAMMSLAGAAALGLSQLGKARQDLQYSADVQQVTDSLVGVGWNKVANGSSTIRGRPISWIVSTLSPNSQRVDVKVFRRGQAAMNLTYTDTVTVFLAKNRVQ